MCNKAQFWFFIVMAILHGLVIGWAVTYAYLTQQRQKKESA